MKIIKFLLCIPVLMILGACQQAVDQEAEIAAIRSVIRDGAEATSRCGEEGARGYASMATEDAHWLPPNEPAIQGRDAIMEWARSFTDLEDCQLRADLSNVVISRSGDIAYSIGSYIASSRGVDGNIQEEVGKFVDTWHKQDDGSWKVAVAIWNTNSSPMQSSSESGTSLADTLDAIDESRSILTESLEQDDMAGILSVLSENHITMAPGVPMLADTDSLTAWHQDRIDSYALSSIFTTDDISLAGDYAIERWHSSLSLTPRDGGTATSQPLKGLWVWQRQPDDSMKLKWSIWNSDEF